MNINQMRQFAAVAKYKSMTRAAQELFVTQQALSKSIKLMQSELGGDLFYSRGQGLQLTDLGNRLLAIVESLLPRYDSCMEMVARLAEQNRNSLSVTYEHVILQYAVPPELLTGTNLSLHIAEDNAACLTEVLSGAADLGVCSRPEELPEELEYISIHRENLMILMRSVHPLAEREYLTVEDLRSRKQIMPSVHSGVVVQYINTCIEAGFYPDFVMESRDFGLMLRSLLQEDLLMPCPSFAVNDSIRGVRLLPLRDSFIADTGIAVRRENHAPAVRDFIERMRKYYEKG